MKHTRMLKLAVKPQGMQEKGKDLKGKEKRKKGMQEGRTDFPFPSLSHILSCATPTLSLTIFPKINVDLACRPVKMMHFQVAFIREL